MQFSNTENKCYKTEDGLIWNSRSVAVCVILDSVDNKTLITKRSDEMMDDPGKWCLVCGYLDRDETIHQAVIREVFEETGLNIEGCLCRLYSIGDSPHHNRQNVTMHFIVTVPRLAIELDAIMKVDPKEISEWEWVDDDYVSSGMKDKVFAFNHGYRLQTIQLPGYKHIGPSHKTVLIYNKGTHFVD